MRHLYIFGYNFLVTICILVMTAQLSAQTWEPTNGPLGGLARDIIIDNSGTLFVVSPSGIFQSTSNADSWERTPGTINTTFFTRMLVSADSNYLFVGTTSLGLYRSTDSGNSWANLNTVLPATNIQDIKNGSNGTLYVGANNGGVFSSSDNGASWEELNNGLTDLRVYAVGQSNNGDLYAGTILTGIYRYSANDTSWQSISTGLGNMRCTSLMPYDANEMLAGTGSGVYKIASGDTAWTAFGSNTTSLSFVTSLFRANSGQLFATTLRGVYLYDSQTNTWHAMNNGISNLRTWRFSQNAVGQLFLASDAGILRSEDNAISWSRQVNGFRAAKVFDMLELNDGTLLAANEYSGIFRTIDDGLNWTASDSGLNSFGMRVIASGPGEYLFAGISGVSGVNRSTDQGHTWDLLNNGFIGSNVRAITANNNLIYAAASSGIFSSADSGNTWIAMPENGLTNNSVRAMVLNSQGALFAGTWNGGVFRIAGNDTTWMQLNNGLTSLLVISLAIDENDNLFAGTSGGGVFRSTDNGDNWEEINQGLTANTINAISIPVTGTLYAATTQGLFYSTDNGDNWLGLNDGLNNMHIKSLIVRPDEAIFAGTDGDGVYRIDITPTSLDQNSDHLPAQFTLSQNYPNPFNPTTNIGFVISESGFVEMKVYDINGRLVKTLVSESLSAGFHSVVWNGKNDYGQRVASGLYFYQIKAGDKFEQVRKMMLIK